VVGTYSTLLFYSSVYQYFFPHFFVRILVYDSTTLTKALDDDDKPQLIWLCFFAGRESSSKSIIQHCNGVLCELGEMGYGCSAFGFSDGRFQNIDWHASMSMAVCWLRLRS